MDNPTPGKPLRPLLTPQKIVWENLELKASKGPGCQILRNPIQRPSEFRSSMRAGKRRSRVRPIQQIDVEDEGIIDEEAGIHYMKWLEALHVLPRSAEKKEKAIENETEIYFGLFQQPNKWDTKILKRIGNDLKRMNSKIMNLPELKGCREFHRQVTVRVERILILVSASLPELGYVQGMNELVLPILYAVINIGNEKGWKLDTVEALAYRTLINLINRTSLGQLYLSTDRMDEIVHKMTRFSELLEQHAPTCAQILKTLDIQPMMYAFRWFIIMFAGEFSLDNVALLWDSLIKKLASLVQYLMYIGVVIVMKTEEKLEPGNFGNTVSALQTHITSLSVKQVIEEADALWKRDHSVAHRVGSFMTGLFS